MALGLKKHLIAFASRRTGVISALLCLACVGMMLLLPVTFTRGTYFSENSLMIGDADSILSFTELRAVVTKANMLEKLPIEGRREQVDASLRKAEATLWHTPLNATIATVAAHRGVSGGSVILTAHLRDAVGTAVVLAVAEELSGAPYLGIDMHFIFVEDDDYQNGLAELPQLTLMNFGAVRAALCLDLNPEASKPPHVVVETLSTGSSAQPNMDLANSIYKLCSGPLSCRMAPWADPPPLVLSASRALFDLRPLLWNIRAVSARQLANNIAGFWHFVGDGLLGSGRGVHGPLRGLGVHAVTLRASLPSTHDKASHVAGVAIGFVRGMNNLCERLHQSFWIYHYVNDVQFVDYDTVQAQTWLGVASLIAGTFRAGPTPDLLLPSVAVLLLLMPAAVVPIFGPLMSHVLSLLWPLWVWTAGVSAESALGVKTACVIFATCALAASTVLCNPMGVIAASYLSLLSLLSPPDVTTGSIPFRLLMLLLVTSLGALPAWATLVTTLPLLPWVIYYSTCLPLLSSCLALPFVPRKMKVD